MTPETTEADEEEVGDEAEAFETDAGTVVERGVDGWPTNTVLIRTDEPVEAEVGRLFQEADEETGEPVEGSGEPVTHSFSYFILSSIEETIEGEQAEFAEMLMGMERGEDGVIRINESAVFASNENGQDGPRLTDVEDGDLAAAAEALSDL